MTALRYGRVSMLLHWLIGLALLGQIAFGFLLDEIAPRNTPTRAGVINLHKSFGIVLGLLIVARLAWRLLYRPPPWPEWMPPWQRTAAHIGHRALYACMIVMPLSGYVASNFSKHGVMLFGSAIEPWGPDLPLVYRVLNGVHVVTAFVFCGLILGHVLATLKHVLVDHDAVFARMWPETPTRLATPSSTSTQASP
jgi:cytochrome b561